ncbi:MAG TPA: hypothetical protein VFE43_09740 [Candidatus Binataceae bacterium]|jgi:hypothetical protein|nr:hypothetical protein [Candidatus Binataceae bacterium]
MPIVHVRQVTLYCESHSNGEPLLMIMGLGGSALAWEPALLRFLKAHSMSPRG